MSGGVDPSSYLHVQIRILNLSAQGIETVSSFYILHGVNDSDGSRGIDVPVDDSDGSRGIDVAVDDSDGSALSVSAASERSVRELKKVKIENSQSSVQLCAVCLEELSVGTEATCMPCSHLFHEDCILKWLEKSTSCPVCRFELPSS